MLKTIFFHHKLVRYGLILLVLDFIVFGGINADRVSQPMLVVGFLLLLINFYAVANGLTKLAKLYGAPIIRLKRLSLGIVVFFGSLVAFQSIGQLNWHDAGAIVPLVLIGYMYVGYISPNKNNKIE